MWHEARRRERATQKLFSDHKKRAEKRREENKVDPSSLLQVHGVKSKVNIDTTTHKLAANSMVVWQGDQKTTIDRFDVRATLSSLPTEEKPKHVEKNDFDRRRKPTVLDANENEYMKKLLTFERYRLVMQNDLNKLSETTRLSLVNKKNDLLSDAQMRKLKNNWFGTSGETSISGEHVNNNSNNNRNTTARHQGVSIGFDYSIAQAEIDDNIPVQIDVSKATAILDLDDCDTKFDLDCVDKPQLSADNIDEVLSRYGLNNDDFNILIDSTSRSSKEIINKLKQVKSEAKRQRETIQSTEVAKHEFYGPALPPEMEKREKNSPSSQTSGNASPNQQRLLVSAKSLINDSDEDSIRDVSTSSTADRGFASQPLDSTRTNNSSIPKQNSPKQSASLEGSNQKKLPSSDVLSTDTEVTTKEVIAPRARRAVTPLAYKRYCRSRSRSRERERGGSSSRSRSTPRSSSSSTDSSPDRRHSSESRRRRSRLTRHSYSRYSRQKYDRRERR